MKAQCSICRHPEGAQIVAHYLTTDSLRLTASCFGVGYRSLQRHITRCVLNICIEQNEREFELELGLQSFLLTKELNERYNAPRLDKRKPRPQPMVTKPVKYTWSRRAWKGEKPDKT
jgi:hypothetical protein